MRLRQIQMKQNCNLEQGDQALDKFSRNLFTFSFYRVIQTLRVPCSGTSSGKPGLYVSFYLIIVSYNLYYVK